MDEERKELEMRIGRSDGHGREDGVAAALRALDPAATIRFDETTGIAHVTTIRDTIEVEDALTRAGFEVTAATG